MTKLQQAAQPSPAQRRFKPDNAEGLLPLLAEKTSRKNEAQWLQNLRGHSSEIFKTKGLPTPRLERWKYANIIPHVRVFDRGVKALTLKCTDQDSLVQPLSEIMDKGAPEWLQAFLAAQPEGMFRYGDMMLWDLNNVLLGDGFVIDVPRQYKGAAPVEIINEYNDQDFTSPRRIIRLADNAALTVIEYHQGQGSFWNNALTQIQIGKNATLRHYHVQECSDQATLTHNTYVDIAQDGTYESFTLTVGAALSRHQLHAKVSEQNAECNIYGLNLLKGQQQADTTLEVEHKAPHCQSNQFIRSVIDDQAKCVFQGKVYVHRGADKTDGYQLSNALLLSEGAEMDTKPELEIYADDVKCSHGATTGQLDDEPLFYLRSRGLNEDEARALLVEAFVGEVVEKLSDEAVHEPVWQRIHAWLG